MRIPVRDTAIYTFTKVFGEGEFHKWIDSVIKQEKYNIEIYISWKFVTVWMYVAMSWEFTRAS